MNAKEALEIANGVTSDEFVAAWEVIQRGIYQAASEGAVSATVLSTGKYKSWDTIRGKIFDKLREGGYSFDCDYGFLSVRWDA